MALSTAQQAQYDRFSTVRTAAWQRKGDKDVPNVDALSESHMEQFTADQIKARVNITSIGASVTWSSECNYSDAQKEYVEAAMPRTNWAVEVPLILAEAAALEADGVSVTLIKSILKSRYL